MPQSQASNKENLAELSGQMHDLEHTTSDDGAVPPTAVREAITTPDPKAALDHASHTANKYGDPALRTEREQPGANGTPLDQALDQDPFAVDPVGPAE